MFRPRLVWLIFPPLVPKYQQLTSRFQGFPHDARNWLVAASRKFPQVKRRSLLNDKGGPCGMSLSDFHFISVAVGFLVCKCRNFDVSVGCRFFKKASVACRQLPLSHPYSLQRRWSRGVLGRLWRPMSLHRAQSYSLCRCEAFYHWVCYDRSTDSETKGRCGQ